MNQASGKPPAPPSLDLSQLRQRIEAAGKALVAERKNDSSKGRYGSNAVDRVALLFAGTWTHNVPHGLLFSPQLGPTEKTIWQIMRAMIHNPNSPGAAPMRDEIAAAVPCSAPTVTKSRKLLRLFRYLTFCDRVRDGGRVVGDIYLMHDSTFPLWETLLMDPEYPLFVQELLEAGQLSSRARAFAGEVIEAIEGSPPAKEQTRMGIVYDQVSSKKSWEWEVDKVKNFNPVNASDLAEKVENGEVIHREESQRKNFTVDDGNKVKNFNPVDETANGQNLDNIGLQATEHHYSKILNPVKTPGKILSPCSSGSSSLINNFPVRVRAREVEGMGHSNASELTATARNLLSSYLPELMKSQNQAVVDLIVSMFVPYQESIPGVSLRLSMLGRNRSKSVRSGKPNKPNTLNVSRFDVSCQLAGRLIAAVRQQSDYVRNLVGYASSLVDRVENGEFALDSYGVDVRQALTEGDPLYVLG